VLQKAERGGHTVASLRAALGRASTPLSHHFANPPPDTGPGPIIKRTPAWPIVAGTAAVAVLIAILLIATRRPGLSPKPGENGGGEVVSSTKEEQEPATSERKRPPIQDQEWKELVARFRRVTDPVGRPAALAPLADYVVQHARDASGEGLRGEYLGLWKGTFASPPRLGADRLAEEASFYRKLRTQLEKIYGVPLPPGSPIPQEEQACLDQLPLL
jgi:hypothetical protein